MWRWCASSSSIPSRARSTRRCSRATRTRARSCGVRRSRRTRAPGTRSATACRSWLGRRRPVLYAGRAPAAAPATGIGKIHEAEQQTLDRGGAACHGDRGFRAGDHAAHRRWRRSPRRGRRRRSADATEKELMSDRDPSSAAARVGRRCDARRLAQAAGRGRQARREPRRPRDRQGRAGSAGARQRRGAGAEGARAARP